MDRNPNWIHFSFWKLRIGKQNRISMGFSAFNVHWFNNPPPELHSSLFVSRRKCKWHIDSDKHDSRKRITHNLKFKQYASHAERDAFQGKQTTNLPGCHFLSLSFFRSFSRNIWMVDLSIACGICVCECVTFNMNTPFEIQISAKNSSNSRCHKNVVKTAKDWKRKKKNARSYLTIDLWCSLFAIQCLNRSLLSIVSDGDDGDAVVVVIRGDVTVTKQTISHWKWICCWNTNHFSGVEQKNPCGFTYSHMLETIRAQNYKVVCTSHLNNNVKWHFAGIMPASHFIRVCIENAFRWWKCIDSSRVSLCDCSIGSIGTM